MPRVHQSHCSTRKGRGWEYECDCTPFEPPEKKPRIYVAGRARIPERPAMWRAFRAEGYPIVSTWIDEAEEGQTADWSDRMSRCVREAASATALVRYVEPGDTPLGMAYLEIGAALGAGAPVFAVIGGVTDRKVQQMAAHPNVRRCETVQEAMRLAARTGGSS